MGTAPAEGSSCAVICEYNPFHHGHLWQLNELKSRFETVICILGGNLTQRGIPSIADRFHRADAALSCGANLVVELPFPWCCASAGDFARGGISIAKRLNAGALAFSAETDEKTLREAAERISGSLPEETSEDHARIPYPKLMEERSGLCLKGRPNDILALEYLRHAGSLPSFILRRNPAYASSTDIRASGRPGELIPREAARVLSQDPSFPRSAEAVDGFLLSSLRNECPKGCYAVPDELRAGILRCLTNVRSVRELASAVSGKMFTVSRVNRALWSSVMRVSPETIQGVPPYALLLAADEAGRTFLKSSSPSVPVVSRPAALKDDPVFSLNLRLNRILGTFYGGEDDLSRRPFFKTSAVSPEE